MSTLKFSNNSSTTLATAISSTATSVTVAAGQGALFPTISAGTGQHFRCTIVKNGTPSQFEIVLVTATSSDTFTIVRHQEGTSAQSWSVGDFFNLFITAADLSEFVQVDDLQAIGGAYAVDSGTANAYSVTLSPALSSHVVGMPIRVKFQNSNTGASSFNDGAGSLSLVTPDLQQLSPGNIQGNGIGVVVFDGARFQLLGTYKVSFSQIEAQISPGQVPQAAVTQFQSVMVFNGSQINSGTVSSARLPLIGNLQGVIIAPLSGGVPALSAGQIALLY